MAKIIAIRPVEALPPARPAPPALRWALRLAALGLLAAAWERLAGGGLVAARAWLYAQTGSQLAAEVAALAGVFLLAMTTLRMVLWLLYRPTPPGAELPTLTVLVPAYNEGPMVRHALNSLAASDYPADKLQIVAIDDGSGDDTYAHMEAASRLHPGRILLLRLSRNRGKRAALEVGFNASRSELVATVDSDCIVARDALRNLVAPLSDSRVAAVAGRVLIHNRRAGFLTRIFSPQFTVTFDFIRAAQSVNGTVLCCPGALSAYRLSAVRGVLRDWMGQKFLGASIGPGEDRHLTTLLLRRGYLSRYQSTARVHTLVPTRYDKICRMLLRWDRCDLRESLEALFTHPKRNGWARLSSIVYVALAAETLLVVPLAVLGLGLSALLLLTHPIALAWGLVGLNLPTLLSVLVCLSSDFSLEPLLLFVYGWIAPAFLWIQPYAVLTLQDQAWMSRDLPVPQPERAVA